MDGVLTDFERHVEQKSGMRINQWSKLPVKERWAILEIDKNFWYKKSFFYKFRFLRAL